MLQSFIILFRETLEVALVIGFVLGYLVRSAQSTYKRSVYLGLAAGLVAGGVHELQEAGAIPIVVEHVWDINPGVAGMRLSRLP